MALLTLLFPCAVGHQAIIDGMHRAQSVPLIDIGPLFDPSVDEATRRQTVQLIGRACMEVGFFYVANHGVDAVLQSQLKECFATFLALPRDVKRQIEMAVSGSAWRGYFEVGEELTKGVVDQKEGLYFAAERPDDTRPLHGANLFPSEALVPGLRQAVLSYMECLSTLSRTLLKAVGEALELPAEALGSMFEEPTTLFRCFHYPPHDDAWGAESTAVGEHTDMGFLTVLQQDESGGLQVNAGEHCAQCIVRSPATV